MKRNSCSRYSLGLCSLDCIGFFIYLERIWNRIAVQEEMEVFIHGREYSKNQ